MISVDSNRMSSTFVACNVVRYFRFHISILRTDILAAFFRRIPKFIKENDGIASHIKPQTLPSQ
jgi:hypothetical protein